MKLSQSPQRRLRSRSVNLRSSIEFLESRIAPAAAFTFTDVDGDQVTIKTSLGTNMDLVGAISMTALMSPVPDAFHLDAIVLSGHPVFDGTDITITAKPGPAGGDGLINVPTLLAVNLDLGKVSIDGDLQNLDAGTAGDSIKIISVHSTSGVNTWEIHGDVVTLKVKTDFRGAACTLLDAGATLGTVDIGGSVIGESVIHTGFISAATINKIVIGKDLRGDGGIEGGYISALEIGTVKISGSIIGGANLGAGGINAAERIESITVNGDVLGGAGVRSGRIHSEGSIGNVKIGGSIVGGLAPDSGSLDVATDLGKVKIGGNLQGGCAPHTGDIFSNAGGITSVTIDGSLIGGIASYSGRIVALGNNVGAIKIGGDIQSVERDSAGTLLIDSGIIFVRHGALDDAQSINIASLTVGGSVIGASHTTKFQITADGTIGPVKIGHDLRGGAGKASGTIEGYEGIGSVKVGGSLIGSTGLNSGSIQTGLGSIGNVQVGGSLVGGTAPVSGRIDGVTGLGNVHVGGDLIGGVAPSTASVTTEGAMGMLTIDGSILGNAGFDVLVIAGTTSNSSHVVMKGIKVGGHVEHGLIIGGSDPDAQIGAVSVGGNWEVSNLIVGAIPGADGQFGTPDDSAIPQMGEPDAIFSKIASIVIGGHVKGTDVPLDHYGFVSQQIGSVKINGIKIPLEAGRSNDTSLSDPHLIVSETRDVTIHEIA